MNRIVGGFSIIQVEVQNIRRELEDIKYCFGVLKKRPYTDVVIIDQERLDLHYRMDVLDARILRLEVEQHNNKTM